MEDNLTIILAVKDRLDLAHRWMRFMNQEQCPYRIIIADGSLDSDSEHLFSNETDFSNLIYEYVRFPPDENYSAYYKKIADALNLVETTYVLMADDDDFFCMEGIQSAINFLDEHSDYVCARGSYLGFTVRNTVGTGTVYGEMHLSGYIYPSATIHEESSAGRLTGYFSRWTPHWYNIHRTEILQECWNTVATLNIRNIFLMEHTLGAMVSIRGKIFTGQYPYYFRQVEGEHVTVSQEAKERDGDWLDQVLSETWSADYKAFVKIISTELKKSDNISEEDSIKIVHTAYRNFFGPTLASVFPVRRNVIETQVISVYRSIKRMLSASERLFRPTGQGGNMKKLKVCECTVRVKNFLASKN